MKPESSVLLKSMVKLDLLEKGLKQDSKFRLQVTSQSMFPLLKAGDYVFIKHANLDRLQRGDLVVMRRTSDLVIHRLMKIDMNGLVHTKGDNVSVKDLPVFPTDIMGRVVAIEQSQHVFDLTKPTWIRINRIIGTLSQWEMNLIQLGYQCQQTWFPKKTGDRVNIQAGEAKETRTQTAAGILKRLIRVLFRLLIRLVIEVSKVRFLRK